MQKNVPIKSTEINAALGIDDYNMINDFCDETDISKAVFITGACSMLLKIKFLYLT